MEEFRFSFQSIVKEILSLFFQFPFRFVEAIYLQTGTLLPFSLLKNYWSFLDFYFAPLYAKLQEELPRSGSLLIVGSPTEKLSEKEAERRAITSVKKSFISFHHAASFLKQKGLSQKVHLAFFKNRLYFPDNTLSIILLFPSPHALDFSSCSLSLKKRGLFLLLKPALPDQKPPYIENIRWKKRVLLTLPFHRYYLFKGEKI